MVKNVMLAMLGSTVAFNASAAGLDEKINEVVAPIVNPFVGMIFSTIPFPFSDVQVPWIVLWLVVAATFFTFYLGFINVRGFKHAIDLVSGKYSDPKAKDQGEVSHFQALTTALSGTVGLGNIAGVAVAVSIGGAGATFWMILAGLLGMSSKFVECALGVKYRNTNPDGSVSGGPMYYLSKGLADRGNAAFGRTLAVLFSVFAIGGALGGGNMFQANQAFKQVVEVTGGASSFLADKGWLFGLILAAIVAVVIIGGIKSIAKVTEKVVPFMAGIYVGTALIIIGMNFDRIDDAFAAIFNGAFTGEGITGGVIGVLIQGFKRAAFSNEAGVGSAAIAHAAVKTKEPMSEGFVSLLEPFIDTVVICTMTALVIIITGYLDNGSGLAGVELTSAAFGSAISWFPYILAIAVVLFAFSTMISWSYYGLKAWTYLFGESKTAELIFKIKFCMFVVIGSAMNLGPVIDFSDAMIFAMALVNIVGLYILVPEVKRDMKDYLARLQAGKVYKVQQQNIEEPTQA
ncbi:alanine:cation symporter family protein [Vibrio vulnificus]|uniref:alanine/glycine:cation symporter family protein n=1 Tax=Vibrio vulnificus TaxID=672 RepID=UPI001CDC0AF3|nr:alanine/glycine:cation symporter family protein [Vibrio vulnificus]EHK9015153.1 alanine:cation symporter family protein [Vibrio vulnificus]EHU4994437.1 alanine:cation symporter family protein [Vibrio vulnificus]EHU5128439.1 alanine:cation symporter family protein [Vibrio vulnificus]ELR8745210.1 alanine:cation symporter family protein [Vibrio vulnificus]MCA3896721.1 alanine:cation symporter family protein [Vibrio vulnificus]